MGLYLPCGDPSLDVVSNTGGVQAGTVEADSDARDKEELICIE